MKTWNTSEIVELAKRGHSAADIKRQLDLPITTRQIQRIVAPHRPPGYRRGSPTRIEADLYSKGSVFRDIVVQLMIELGHNPKICHFCRKPSYKPLGIHHLRYQGATIRDLVFCCQKCNLRSDNIGLF
jgi:hypothetical protein